MSVFITQRRSRPEPRARIRWPSGRHLDGFVTVIPAFHMMFLRVAPFTSTFRQVRGNCGTDVSADVGCPACTPH